MRGYYQRLLWIAIGHSYGLADAISSLTGIFMPPILWASGFQDSEIIVGHLVWQMPLAAFIFAFLPRLVLAPCWMHQEDESKRKAERAEEEMKLAELEAKSNQQASLLNARTEDNRKRDERKACLAELMKEGNRLYEATIREGQFREWEHAYKEWRACIDSEVGRLFSVAEATRLSSLEYACDRNVRGVNGNHQEARTRISIIKNELDKLFQYISASPRPRVRRSIGLC